MTWRSLLAAVLLVVPVACQEPARDEVLVAAAASLGEVVLDLERSFEDAHPDVDLVVNLGGSSTLRTQIQDGAPVDVLLSADRSNVDELAASGDAAGEAVGFAHNRLQLAVAPGNPGNVGSLGALAEPSLAVGLCDAHVPCGALAERVLAAAGVAPSVDTREPDVGSLVAKLLAGELDAGLVYVTDVGASDGGLEAIGRPSAADLSNEYVAIRTARSPNPAAAETFLGFLTTDEASRILASHGFDP